MPKQTPSSPGDSFPRTPIRDGAIAEVRLQQLGLPGSSVVVDALGDGAAGARAATEYHPKSYAGQRMWGDTTAALRIYLEPYGWESCYFLGVDLVLNRERGLALIVTAGDAATGACGHMPQVRYERQEVIQGLVNGHVDSLFDAHRPPEWEVWFVLHFLSNVGFRGEVSRPSGIDRAGRVSTWVERVLLPTTPFSGSRGRGRRTPNAPSPVNVDVRRRAI